MEISCPNCKARLSADDSAVGTLVSCPNCDEQFYCNDETRPTDSAGEALWQLAQEELQSERQAGQLDPLSSLRKSPLVLTVDSFVHPEFQIVRMLPMIAARQVYGVNAFKDLAMQFRDAFGGRSQTAEQAIAQMESGTLKELQQAARSVHAHAVIGVRMQIGEISGKGTNILFVAAQGTPIVLASASRALHP